MSKGRVSSTIVLFLGFSALLLFAGRLSPFNGPGEMSTLTNVTKTFMPYDEFENCTVISICNPTTTDATVKIVAYTIHGDTYFTTTFTLPKKSLLRICSDPVSFGPLTWQEVMLVDFQELTAYAKITYPSALKITGYIAWQAPGASYDPRMAVQTLPLAFL